MRSDSRKGLHWSEISLFVVGFLGLALAVSSLLSGVVVWGAAVLSARMGFGVTFSRQGRLYFLPLTLVGTGLLPLLFSVSWTDSFAVRFSPDRGATVVFVRSAAALAALVPVWALEGSMGFLEIARKFRLPGFLVEIVWHMLHFLEIFGLDARRRRVSLASRGADGGTLSFRIRSAGSFAGGLLTSVHAKMQVRTWALATRGEGMAVLERPRPFRGGRFAALLLIQIFVAVVMLRTNP